MKGWSKYNITTDATYTGEHHPHAPCTQTGWTVRLQKRRHAKNDCSKATWQNGQDRPSSTLSPTPRSIVCLVPLKVLPLVPHPTHALLPLAAYPQACSQTVLFALCRPSSDVHHM